MLEMKCTEFLDKLGSDAPVPGGGSAAAYVGALGMALGLMVGALSIGKAAEQDARRLEALQEEAGALVKQLEAAVNKDVEAFAPVAEAYRMPKGTEEEKAARSAVIQARLVEATMAPLQLMQLCHRALALLDEYASLGDRQVISDAGTGAAFSYAALRAAYLNVLINTRTMKDQEAKARIKSEAEGYIEEGRRQFEELLDRVERECRG